MTRRLFIPTLLLCGMISIAVGQELEDGVGAGPHTVLKMRFEVTFMKFDVADVEARITPELAARIDPHVQDGKSKDGIRNISTLLLEADTLFIGMRYLRDAEFDKFSKGILRQLEAARDSERIDQAELDRMWSDLAAQIEPLRERGVAKGEELVYRVDGDRVRMLLRAPDGSVHFDLSRDGPEWARAVTGGFFGRKSRFGKKLVESLFEEDG